MTYGTIKVDTVTFTDAGIDKSVTLSGLVQNPTFSGNVTVTGTLSGVTVTGTTANFASGNFTNISGGTHTITSGVFAAGSAANPSITFTGDLNTGIYSPGADQVAISTGGSGRLFVDASGTLKVGTSADPTFGVFPRPAFYIKQLSDPNSSWGGIHIEASGEQSVFGIGYDGNLQAFSLEASYRSTGGFRPIVFKTGSTERLRITSAGLVGVGTSSPAATLDVNGSAQVTGSVSGFGGGEIRLGSTTANTQSAITTQATGAPALIFDHRGTSNTGTFAWRNGTGGANPLMTLDGSGRLGVGATSVSTWKFHVAASDQYVANFYQSGGSSHGNKDGNISFFDGTYYNNANYWAHSHRWNVNGGGTEAMRLDSSGRLGIGTSSPSTLLHVSGPTGTTFTLDGANDYSSTAAILMNQGRSEIRTTIAASGGNPGGSLLFRTRNNSGSLVDAVTIDSSQRVGIGTTSPARPLDVNGSVRLSSGSVIEFGGTVTNFITGDNGSNYLAFGTNSSERARIDSSGRLLVGTSTSASGSNIAPYAKLQVVGNTAGGADKRAVLNLSADYVYTGLSTNDPIGTISFNDNSGREFAWITGAVDGTVGNNDYPGRLVFSTTADGASSPTERMRIDNAGSLIYGTSTSPGADITSGTGFYYQISTGLFYVRSNGSPVAAFNRGGDDGTLVEFKQDQTTEGTISVSGTTVSYNGAHLSRWSQLPSGQERTEILRGSVLSNIDEMCEWGNEENEQLNRMKVSDVEGDKNVSGVFQAWDNDDDTYTNDFYCAMTGDFIIRIAPGVTVERGDLLMSAGDGTAKPQDDDIIRSKTIAKVTSINVSCTYDDGSYCVPCVLMAC